MKKKALFGFCLVLGLAPGCRQKAVDDAAFDLAQKPIVLTKCKTAMTALMSEMTVASAPLAATGGKLEVSTVQGLGSVGEVTKQCGAPQITDPGAGVQVMVTLFKGTEHQCTLTARPNSEIENNCKN